MTVDEAFRKFDTYINKDVNGYFNPQEREDLFNDAQVEYFNNLISPQPKERIQIEGVNTNTNKKDSLLPFKVADSIPLTIGVGTFPSDYAYYSASRMRYYTNPDDCPDGTSKDLPGVPNYVPIDEVNEDEWADRINSSIDYPTMRYPIFRFVDKTTLEVSPNTIGMVSFIYYRNPKKMYWGRNQNQTTGYFFDATDPAVVNPEWFDIDMNQIIMLAVQKSGIPLANDRLFQQATHLTNEKQ